MPRMEKGEILIVEDKGGSMKNPMRKNMSMLPFILYGMMGMPSMDSMAPGNSTKIFERECLLKGCNNMTTHNGGFCCAEHCREFDQQHKRKSK